MLDFNKRIEEYCEIIENAIDDKFNIKNTMQQTVFDAMRYSISAGGKRIRPILLLEFFRVCGGKIEDATDFACAIEMIHTYSLIHDDLPCMDDDDMRRGKPSCHKVFGYANALLAGDALLNRAFETMLAGKSKIAPDLRIKAAGYISECTGADGMVGGQVIDLESEGKDISEEILLRLYKDKTAALLRASAVSGVILSGADDSKIKAAENYALNIGLAFQIVDDILDCVSTQEVLGKPIGSDKKNDKKTYVSFYGLDGARKEAKRLTENALDALNNFDNTEFLRELSLYLCDREK